MSCLKLITISVLTYFVFHEAGLATASAIFVIGTSPSINNHYNKVKHEFIDNQLNN